MVSVEGSFAFGAAWAGVGIAFAAIAAVAAQLTRSARTATGIGVETVLVAWRAVTRQDIVDAPVRLRGLDPAARYRDADSGALVDGAVLQYAGLDLGMPAGDQASVLRHLRRSTD